MKRDINLFDKTVAGWEQEAHRTRAAYEARKTLESMVSKIKIAGGEISEEDLASSSVGDFLYMAACNGLKISLMLKNYEKSH